MRGATNIGALTDVEASVLQTDRYWADVIRVQQQKALMMIQGGGGVSRHRWLDRHNAQITQAEQTNL